MIKKKILNILNRVISPFNIHLVKGKIDTFDMFSAVARICTNHIDINTVIDTGASNGKWCLEVMKIIPNAIFNAIEPLAEREDALIEMKKKYPNFDYEICAAGDVDGKKVKLNIASDLDGSTIDANDGTIPREVPLRTIDSIVNEKKLKGPFLLKFDTHGYERLILSGAKDTLKNTEIIIMEVYNFKITEHAIRFHEMCSYMETLGFRCYDLANPMLRPYDNALWQMDLFFCRSNSKIFEHGQYE